MAGTLSEEDPARPATFTTGAHQPFLLDDPARAFRVEQGHLDLFAVELVGGARTSRRPFVTRIPAGSMCFGVRPVAGEPASEAAFCFLAVPSAGAVLAEVERSAIVSVEDFDLDTTILIDDWVSGLSEFLTRGGRPPPRDARLVEADPDVPYPAGAALSAYPSSIVWVSADQPMRLLGRDEPVVAPGRGLTPLSSRTWIELSSICRRSICHSASAAGSRMLSSPSMGRAVVVTTGASRYCGWARRWQTCSAWARTCSRTRGWTSYHSSPLR